MKAKAREEKKSEAFPVAYRDEYPRRRRVIEARNPNHEQEEWNADRNKYEEKKKVENKRRRKREKRRKRGIKTLPIGDQDEQPRQQRRIEANKLNDEQK